MNPVPNRPRLKICGVTNAADARLVSASGADYCGILVEVAASRRSLPLPAAAEVAAAATIPVVILLCDAPPELVMEAAARISPHAVQLHGHESPDYVRGLRRVLRCEIWKALHLPPLPEEAPPDEYAAAGVDAFLLDSVTMTGGVQNLGGTGTPCDWDLAAQAVRAISKPVFLAGGITPENVGDALRRVRPYGIDLCSGVERVKGQKDPDKVRRLVEAIRHASGELAG